MNNILELAKAVKEWAIVDEWVADKGSQSTFQGSPAYERWDELKSRMVDLAMKIADEPSIA